MIINTKRIKCTVCKRILGTRAFYYDFDGGIAAHKDCALSLSLLIVAHPAVGKTRVKQKQRDAVKALTSMNPQVRDGYVALYGEPPEKCIEWRN